MNSNARKPRAAMPEILSRFARPSHTMPPRVKPTRRTSAPARTSPFQAARVADARQDLLDELREAGASAEVISVIERHLDQIAETTAEAAAKQALAENARQRLMCALRFAVGANPEGASLLRAEQQRQLKEIAELQKLNQEKDAMLQVLAGGQSGRYFKSLGNSICKDTRELLNRLDAYENALAGDNPALARSVVAGLRTLCENLEAYGENCIAYSNQ